MNKLAVSEGVGVILMVALTIAIASIVFIYVTNGLDRNDVSDSYDNLIIKDGYFISNSHYNRISGTNYIYFVSYDLMHRNASVTGWYTINGFIYDKANDYLYFLGESDLVVKIVN